jgi:hypothetical protein
MGRADSLSRRPDLKEGVENDNQDIVMLKPEMFRINGLKRGHVLIDGAEKGLLRKIKESQKEDDEVVEVVKSMKEEGMQSIYAKEWSEEQGLILHRGLVYVPKNEKIQK